jgi:hypothetical protein
LLLLLLFAGDPPKPTLITDNYVLHAPKDGDIARDDDVCCVLL